MLKPILLGSAMLIAIPAFAQTASAASFGTIPSSAIASSACASISNQIRNLVSGAQMLAIWGRE